MRGILLASMLIATVLAGCSDSDAPATDDAFTDVDGVDATSETGGIRGVVVDQSIQPVSEAKVVLMTGEETQTDANGAFVFSGLAPGDYFLSISKPGYNPTQATAPVVAGVALPDVVKVVMERLVGMEPYVELIKFDAFFECHFGAPFIVDNCDMAVRTVADGLNETVGNPGVPRGVQDNRNTLYVDVGSSTQTVIQEAWWGGDQVSEMMILLSSTPIDNLCDCSDMDYLETVGPSPTLGRIDGEIVPAGEKVAIRGFVPFGDPQLAVNHEFVIITSFFHNFQPVEGWNFEDFKADPIQ